VLFVGLTRVDESKVMPIPWSDENKNYDNTNVALYDSLVKQVCEEQGLPYLDLSTLLTLDELEDGLHPDANGHEKMYKAVKYFLSKHI